MSQSWMGWTGIDNDADGSQQHNTQNTTAAEMTGSGDTCVCPAHVGKQILSPVAECLGPDILQSGPASGCLGPAARSAWKNRKGPCSVRSRHLPSDWPVALPLPCHDWLNSSDWQTVLLSRFTESVSHITANYRVEMILLHLLWLHVIIMIHKCN